MKLILDLCSGTGAWSQPYADAGYEVECIDVESGRDVRLLQTYPRKVRGILAAPPCTIFARSGARWWKEKGEEPLLKGLSIVDACMRIIAVHQPKWWALENPAGRLYRWLGPPSWSFDPCDYGTPWTKKTNIWGTAKKPKVTPVEPQVPNPIHYAAPGPDRARFRSQTPPGFALAFFEANP